MIYIEVAEDGMVTFIHWMPFDTLYGMEKTEEELQKTGYLVENIPEYEQPVPENMRTRLYYKEGEFSWKLEEVGSSSNLPTYEELLTMAQAIERGMTT